MKILPVLHALFIAFSCTVPSEQVHQAQEEPVAQRAETESHMITMTENVFEGSHSKAHIKEKMD